MGFSNSIKKTIVFGTAFGCALAIIALLGAVVLNWYWSQPKSWDTGSITCLSATAIPTYTYTPESRDVHISGFEFKFVLVNNGRRDYTVPQDVKLFRRHTGSKALQEFDGKLNHPSLLLAGDRAELIIDAEVGCGNEDLATGQKTERDEHTCFQDAFGDLVGFVALDSENKVRVNLLKPTLVANERGDAGKHVESQASTIVPPDKGGVFARFVSCREADRLVSLCKKQNFVPRKGSYLGSEGYQVPLPSFGPEPPSGYKLDASPETCEIAMEWQNFCRKRE